MLHYHEYQQINLTAGEKGASGFYEEPKRRGAVVLTPEVLEQAQQLLSDGAEIADVAEQLTLKVDTLRKAVAAGKLHKPVKKKRKMATPR